MTMRRNIDLVRLQGNPEMSPMAARRQNKVAQRRRLAERQRQAKWRQTLDLIRSILWGGGHPEPEKTLLKPCPFCGGAAELVALGEPGVKTHWCVVCTKCQAEGATWWGSPTAEVRQTAIDGWNRRTALQGDSEIILQQQIDQTRQNAAKRGDSQSDQPWVVFSPLQLFFAILFSHLLVLVFNIAMR